MDSVTSSVRVAWAGIKGERLIIGKLEGWPDLKIRVLPAAGPTPNLTNWESGVEALSEALGGGRDSINQVQTTKSRYQPQPDQRPILPS